MQQNRLGRSSIVVSDICMGTMTFGNQADEKTSFRIMDMAYDAGVDFYDTAEMYPVPPDASYVGDTEEIVGRWLKTKDRDAITLATKVVGPGHGWITPPLRLASIGISSSVGQTTCAAIVGPSKKPIDSYISMLVVP